jgi:hypothetical protein
MSFAERIIREYRMSYGHKRRQLAEVYFTEARPDELHIKPASEDWLSTGGQVLSEEEVERRLAQEGLIRMPFAGRQLEWEFKRINVDGKPVSEMIIEERR